MTNLEKLLQVDDDSLDLYFEDVTYHEFRADIRELMQAYSDNGVIDKAIELLQSCRTTE